MKIQVLFFGVLTDVTACESMEVMGLNNSDDILQHLHERYPLLCHYKFSIAVNQAFVYANTLLNDGDEMALMPPFAGG